VTVEALARCRRDQVPFSTLRKTLAWPTVADAVTEYVDWLTGHAQRERATAAGASTQLARFAARFGSVPLHRVPHDDAAKWQEELLAAVAVGTARVYVARVVALYHWHARREARAAAKAARAPRPLACPLDPDTRPTVTPKRERYLTREEATRVVAATPEAFLAPLACGLLAGLRIEEILHLRPEADIDFGRDMLVIQTRGTKGQPGYWRTKTGQRREVPITADLRPLLAGHLARYGSVAYAFPSPAHPAHPMDAETYRRHFRRVVTGAGLVYGRTDPNGVVPHTLRHTFASWLVAADVNPYRVAKLLGNSLKMIETTYGHLAPKDNAAAVALLSGAVPFPQMADSSASEPSGE
jgi:integrase